MQKTQIPQSFTVRGSKDRIWYHRVFKPQGGDTMYSSRCCISRPAPVPYLVMIQKIHCLPPSPPPKRSPQEEAGGGGGGHSVATPERLDSESPILYIHIKWTRKFQGVLKNAHLYPYFLSYNRILSSNGKPYAKWYYG